MENRKRQQRKLLAFFCFFVLGRETYRRADSMVTTPGSQSIGSLFVVVNSRLSFWRDEAGLDLFSSEKRWKAYWIVPVSILLSISGIGVTFYKISQDWTLIAAIIMSMAYPVCFIIEMFTKGGDAGMRLMGSGPVELYQIRTHVDSLCKWMKTPGRTVANPDELKCRVEEMCFELFGTAPHLGEPDDLPSFLNHAASVIESMKPMLAAGSSYKTDWRPKRWNEDIKDDLLRDKNYDTLVSPC